MTTALNVSTSVHSSLNQFNFDVYLPVKDEKELEDLAEGHPRLENNFILAGIVFDSLDLNSSSHSKIGKVRIRPYPGTVVLQTVLKAL